MNETKTIKEWVKNNIPEMHNSKIKVKKHNPSIARKIISKNGYSDNEIILDEEDYKTYTLEKTFDNNGVTIDKIIHISIRGENILRITESKSS